MRRLVALALVSLVLLSGCATAASSPVESADALTERLAAIDVAVQSWRTAGTLAEAQAFAEGARNLVVGPHGPYYGDADGDGTVSGETAEGLLPGLEGEPGIAVAIDGTCISRDMLGGDWSDPVDRWEILDTAITDWAPANNSFPALPSHPQRVVGWASLTLAAENLDEAQEYAGHAALHVRIAQAAIDTECVSQ